MKCDVVAILFPFSDLSNAKNRPAMVVTELNGQDFISCQITSQPFHDEYTISLSNTDFFEGSINKASNIHPNRLFTADQRIIEYRIGKTSPEKIKEVISKIVEIITNWSVRTEKSRFALRAPLNLFLPPSG